MKEKLPNYVLFYVYALIDKSRRENILGDLAEKYTVLLLECGELLARKKLRRELLRSTWKLALLRIFRIYKIIFFAKRMISLLVSFLMTLS